jgi:general secretion pathway protein D
VLSFQPNSFGQVPVDEVENNPSASEAQAGQALPLENSGFGVLSDPDELSLVDGLDDELERLRLRDQDTTGILEMIQIITERYILRPQNLPQVKINFDSFTVLTKRQTLRVLESLLAMNGIGITKIDDQFFKAVPAANMNVHVPIWLDGPASEIKPNQNIYTKMFYLEQMTVEQMREILNPFATPNVSTLITYPKADAILVTDSLLNLQRMEKMIEKMDKPANRNVVFFTHKLMHLSVDKEYLSGLNSMFKKETELGKELTAEVEIEKRGEHTLLIRCHKNDEGRLKEIFQKIDFEFDLNFGSALIGLRYAKAEDVVSILDQLTGGGDSSSNRPKPNSNPGAPKPATNPTQSGGPQTYRDKSNLFSQYFNAVPDPRTNSVFASGSPNDIKLAKEKVKELDKALPMAQIDTIFVMVTLTGDTSRGIEMFGNALYENTEPGNVSQPDGTSRFSPGGDSLSFSANLPIGGPMTFGFENGKLNSIAWNNIFKIAQTSTDSRVFSSPAVVVSHAQKKAQISMVNSRTVFTESMYNSVQGGSSNLGNEKEFKSETSLTLEEISVSLPTLEGSEKIYPGAVQTKLTLVTSNFDDLATSTYNGQTVPAIQGRTLSTMLTIKDNQIIALGGLQQVKHTRAENQYALLRKIPVLGKSLFTPKTENYEPTELLIFIRSKVLKQDEYSTSTPEDSIQPSKIDRMMSENYVPKFKSPNSSGLTTEPIFYEFDTVNSDKTLPVDVPSSKPVF